MPEISNFHKIFSQQTLSWELNFMQNRRLLNYSFLCEQGSMKDEIQFMVTQCTQSGISIYLHSVYIEKFKVRVDSKYKTKNTSARRKHVSYSLYSLSFDWFFSPFIAERRIERLFLVPISSRRRKKSSRKREKRGFSLIDFRLLRLSEWKSLGFFYLGFNLLSFFERKIGYFYLGL